jgi:hypothetical protein
MRRSDSSEPEMVTGILDQSTARDLLDDVVGVTMIGSLKRLEFVSSLIIDKSP